MMSDTLSPLMRERIDAAMMKDERMSALYRPRWSWFAPEVMSTIFFAAVWLSFVIAFTFFLGGGEGMPMLLLLPFWLVGIGMVVGVLVHRARVLRTVYLITDRRAIVLRPSWRFTPQVVAWPLSPNMVKEYKERSHGVGDIVLGYKNYEVNDRPAPDGFLHVPNVREVYDMLLRQIGTDSAEMPEAEPQQVASLLNGHQGNMPQKHPGCAGIVFLVMGSLFFGLGLFFYTSESDLEERGIQTEATVVKMVRSESGKSTSYFPVVKFKDEQGKEHKVKSSHSSSELDVGDKVSLRYLPEDPQEIDIAGDSSTLLYIMFMAFGGIAQLIGLAMMVTGQWKKQAAARTARS